MSRNGAGTRPSLSNRTSTSWRAEWNTFVTEGSASSSPSAPGVPRVCTSTQATSPSAQTSPAGPTTSDDDRKIIQILEEYIRPAVEGDGGHIAFRSFNDGLVTVTLRGACSGCPSSMITLKQGIENLLHLPGTMAPTKEAAMSTWLWVLIVVVVPVMAVQRIAIVQLDQSV